MRHHARPEGLVRVRGTVGVGVRIRLRIRLSVRIRVRVRIRAKVRARARVRVRVRDHHVRPEGLQDRGAERVSISTILMRVRLHSKHIVST